MDYIWEPAPLCEGGRPSKCQQASTTFDYYTGTWPDRCFFSKQDPDLCGQESANCELNELTCPEEDMWTCSLCPPKGTRQPRPPRARGTYAPYAPYGSPALRLPSGGTSCFFPSRRVPKTRYWDVLGRIQVYRDNSRVQAGCCNTRACRYPCRHCWAAGFEIAARLLLEARQ